MSGKASFDWSAQRVLITGGGGVLGTALQAAMRSRAPAALRVLRRSDFDLLDQALVFAAMAEFSPTLVFHLAGRVAGIQGNLSFAGQAYYENALMNLNVVEGARRAGAAKVVAAGTTAIYSDVAPLPMRERDIGMGPPHGSEAPYAQAKLGLLAQLEAYQTQYGMQYAYLVCTNMYGPNDRFDEAYGHVVPSLISRFHRLATEGAASATVWGDGSPTRDFLFSADAASAFLRCAEAGEGVFNTATGNSVPIRRLVETIAEISGFAGEIVWDTTKPMGQLARSYNVDRLHALGWTAPTDLHAGIQQTYRWFADHAATARR
jgi:GDP-L-fucose synthase